MNKKVLILDYSVDQIEAAAIQRWLPASAEILALFIDTAESFPDDLLGKGFTHVIHSGSSLSITETSPFTKKAIAAINGFRDQGTAQFGICYGHQLVSLALVGQEAVRSSPNGLEAGWGPVDFTALGMDILEVRDQETVWQSHFDEVIALPAGSELLATNPHTEIQAYINFEQKILGTQFHPEFDKVAGDQLYLDEREMLAKHGYDVEDFLPKEPSIPAGEIFFDYFLQEFS
jgi:GMP synthase (glutamine-hydrolysing)